MEELKERLEPGARRQLPLQCPNQPRSPPAPSPPPAACSPHPEVSRARLQGERTGLGVQRKMLGWRSCFSDPLLLCPACRAPH